MKKESANEILRGLKPTVSHLSENYIRVQFIRKLKVYGFLESFNKVMAAAYDTYDYTSYWEGREYEHQAELIALEAFFKKIPEGKIILEVGSGFGRLLPSYFFRARKVILTDPSAKALKNAKQKFGSKNINFIQSKLENLPNKVKADSIDIVIVIRVLHHIVDLDAAFTSIKKVLKKNGFLILEFANKRHIKATLIEFLRGNFTFPLDIFTKDVTNLKVKQTKPLPFKNYHPDLIFDKLKEYGFVVIETRSVSNIRFPVIKKFFPLNLLLLLERLVQKPLTLVSFGPSIFVLAKKVK